MGPEGEWLRVAQRSLLRLAGQRSTLTSDDLWFFMRREYPALVPREPRSIGAVFLYGQRQGWITRSERTVVSAQRQCHGRGKTVWVSLIHQEMA